METFFWLDWIVLSASKRGCDRETSLSSQVVNYIKFCEAIDKVGV